MESNESYPPTKADMELYYLIKARYSLIYAVTWEERRLIDSLAAIVDREDINLGGVQVWDSARGLVDPKGFAIPTSEPLTENPMLILEYISQKAEENKTKDKSAKNLKENRGPVFVLCDLFRYLEKGEGLTPELERKLRSLAGKLKRSSITVVISSPELQLPLSLEKVVTVLDYPLPGPEQLGSLVAEAKKKLVDRKRVSKASAEAVPTENIVRALLGLTTSEAEDAIAKAVVCTDNFDIPILLELKRQIIRKGQILDYIYSEEGLDDIGGLAGIKQWIRVHKKAFGDRGRAYGLPAPKGIFLLGVQGSGKSLCAKAIARELQFPLLKFDVGRVFGSLIGESEGRMRQALKLAESIAPCVLLVDEMEKALSGADTSHDGGTTKRVISTMLDWMQEKTAPVFIVACANAVKSIDPALLRRGRFDELFFVDFPNEAERRAIFAIHLKKPPRNRNPEKFDLGKLVTATHGFSGAEIEAVIIDAMNAAFDDNEREFTTEDIVHAARICVPLSKIMKVEIDEIKESAKMMRRAADPLVFSSDKNEDLSRFDMLDVPSGTEPDKTE